MAGDRTDGESSDRGVPLSQFVDRLARHLRDGKRCTGDDGFVGGFEGLLFGMLIFVTGTLLVAFAWAVVDTKGDTEEAAREAARALVQAPVPAAGTDAAKLAAELSLSGLGRDPSRAVVTISARSLSRCARVTVTVTYPAPLLYLPFAGRVGSGTAVSSAVSELIDPYRSGLPGVAACQ